MQNLYEVKIETNVHAENQDQAVVKACQYFSKHPLTDLEFEVRKYDVTGHDLGNADWTYYPKDAPLIPEANTLALCNVYLAKGIYSGNRVKITNLIDSCGAGEVEAMAELTQWAYALAYAWTNTVSNVDLTEWLYLIVEGFGAEILSMGKYPTKESAGDILKILLVRYLLGESMDLNNVLATMPEAFVKALK